MSGRNKFRIDILNSGGDPIGDGPLITATRLNFSKRLDRVGEASFSFPAADARIALIQPGVEFDIYDDIIGYVGRYIFRDIDIQDKSGEALASVTCWDAMYELALWITGMGRNFQATAVETIVDTLVGEVADWTTETGVSLGTSTVTYQGQTVMEAVSELAERHGLHFRLNRGKVLAFNAFGTKDEAVRLVRGRGQFGAPPDDVAFVTSITRTVEDDELYNRIIALGAGEGSGQITLENAAGDIYSVASRTPATGQTMYYIEDTVSSTAYGVREQVVVFDKIHPIANTDTAMQQAIDELYTNVETYLLRHKDPLIEYTVQVRGLRRDVLPGDKIRLIYRGKTDDNIYLDVDDFFWVLDIRQRRSTGGDYGTTFTLLNIDRRRFNDMELITRTVQAVRSEKLVVKPTAFRLSDTYTDTIQNGNGNYQDKDAEFTLTIDDTVMAVTRVILKWKTTPLSSTSVWAAHTSPGVTGVNNSGGDPHTHTLITGIDGFYQVVIDDDYPTDVTMKINGTNVNNHVDVDYITGGTGPWNSGGTPNSALDVEMDITDFILNAGGGIYQTFDITLEATTARTRNVAVPFWSGSATLNQAEGNHGMVEMKIIIHGIGQALYKT